MKKLFTLTKTLLVAAGLCVGTSAWAQYSLTDNGDGTYTETYDFLTPSKSFTGNIYCYSNGTVSVTGTSSVIMAHSKIEMNDRFAAQNGASDWMIQRNNGLYSSASGGRKFAILNLHEGDVVTVKKDAVNMSFSGSPNAYKTVDGDVNQGDALESEVAYTIKSDGNLFFSATRYVHMTLITIRTSMPVLTPPTFSFSNMVEKAGLYYPKVTLSSTDEDVTYNAAFNSSAADVTSGYTFTTTGTLSVYTSKAGRTNSAKRTYSVSNGWILANSVNCYSLKGNSDYADGTKVLGNGSNVSNATWAIPGINLGANMYYYYYSDAITSSYIRATSGNRSVSCSVLNENRVATFYHYYYETGKSVYDYLTSTNNSATFHRSGSNYDNLYQYNLYVNPSEEVSVTIGSTGYSTYSSPVPLDFSGVSGLTAYVATSVGGSYVTLSPVATAPANTGLVLVGTAGETYNIPVTASAEAPESNLLVGCIVNTAVAADATSGFNNYVLVNNNGTPEFQSLVANGATIPGGKAFLKNGTYSAGTRTLSIVFDENNTTSISTIANSQELTANSYYDLQGRRVAQPTKGLYIVNGKKVVVK